MLHTSQVSYFQLFVVLTDKFIDSIGLHRISNPSLTQSAFSLHRMFCLCSGLILSTLMFAVYTPPAVICRIFDGNTGESEACRL